MVDFLPSPMFYSAVSSVLEQIQNTGDAGCLDCDKTSIRIVYLSGWLLWRDAALADLQLGLDDKVDVWTKGLWIFAFFPHRFELLIGDAYKTNLGSFFGSPCVVNDKEDLNLLMCGSTGGLWIIIPKPNMFSHHEGCCSDSRQFNGKAGMKLCCVAEMCCRTFRLSAITSVSLGHYNKPAPVPEREKIAVLYPSVSCCLHV